MYDQKLHVHCQLCFHSSKFDQIKFFGCSRTEDCPIVSCENNCGFNFHECKRSEHLANTCPNETVSCINECNGCLIKMPRKHSGVHLKSCVASVIRCNSYRVRSLLNNQQKFLKLKWPDPIEIPKNELIQSNASRSLGNINNILLDQDMRSLRKFAENEPLRFHRLYGYLIGLDVGRDYSKGRFSFMRILLKSVKSKIFKDIEAENCIVYNDEDGCSACRNRVRNMEVNRFNEMKINLFDFYYILKEVNDLDAFIELKMYEREDFLKIYNKHFANRNDDQDEINKLNFTSEEINKKLIANNQEILSCIEFKWPLMVNIQKELPCESFCESFEAYRLKETSFTSDCDLVIRRDEFSEHYEFFHNFLLPRADFINLSCPLKCYGCDFFVSKIDFVFGKFEKEKFQNLENLMPSLVANELTNCLSFDFELSNRENSMSKGLMDLPYEVIYEIIDRLDSLSLYCLSITSKEMRKICEKFLQLRGIVNSKWTQVVTESLNEETMKKRKKVSWKIEKLAYSFSKHIHSPSTIKLKAKENSLSMHLLKCPYNIKEPKQRTKVFPPFTGS